MHPNYKYLNTLLQTKSENAKIKRINDVYDVKSSSAEFRLAINGVNQKPNKIEKKHNERLNAAHANESRTRENWAALCEKT